MACQRCGTELPPDSPYRSCDPCSEQFWKEHYATHKCNVCGEQSTQDSTVPIPASWDVCDICAAQLCMPYESIIGLLQNGHHGVALFDVNPVLALSIGASLARLNIPVKQLLEDAGIPAFKEMVA